MVFDEVQADLEAEGYEVQPFVLPACAVNAPHRRDRVWFVAYSESRRINRINGNDTGKTGQNRRRNDEFNGSSQRLTFNPNNQGGTAGFGGIQKEDGEIPEWDNDAKFGNAGAGVTTNPANQGRKEREPNNGRTDSKEDSAGLDDRLERFGSERIVADTNGSKRCKRRLHTPEPEKTERHFSPCNARSYQRPTWDNFPTQRPVRLRDDGVSSKLLIFVVNELYAKISNTSKENRIENLSEVWAKIQSPEVWEQIRRFYSLESKALLLKTMQLYSPGYIPQNNISPFGEELCKPILQHLRKYGEFRRSPQGQELQKQRTAKFGNALSFLPHEIALAARRFETAIAKFETWHRNESIKAYGNAIVPQVAYQIFKAINQMQNEEPPAIPPHQ
jgi:site-specific DNA-cytosine methylase